MKTFIVTQQIECRVRADFPIEAPLKVEIALLGAFPEGDPEIQVMSIQMTRCQEEVTEEVTEEKPA